MHVFLDLRTLNLLPSASRFYLLALLDAIFPTLREGDRLTVLRGEGDQFPFRRIDHPAIVYCTMFAPARSARGEHELDRIAAIERPDVYWSADPLIRPPMGLKGKELIIAFSVETLALFKENVSPSWWKRSRAARRARHIWASAHAFFCPSHAFEVLFVAQQGLSVRRRTVVVPNGVHPIFRRHTEEEILTVRRRWLLPKRYVLMAGSSQDAESLKTPLQALAMSEEVSTITCVILGDESLQELLRETIRECHLEGLVRFLDEAKLSYADRSAIYSGAIVTFDPIQDYAYRATVLRSLACGTPVICAATPESEELYGNAVLRVHPTDPAEWGKAYTTLMLSNVLRERQIARGEARVVERTWTATAKLSMHLLRAIVEGRAPRTLSKLLV